VFDRLRAAFSGAALAHGSESRAVGAAVETRDISSVPWDMGGPSVPRVSQARALSLVPVFAAGRHLSDGISTLPLKSYRVAGDTRRPMTSLPQLFQQMKDDGTLVPWLCQGIMSAAIRGSAVGYITARDGFGFPTAITWLSLERVYVDDSAGVGQWQIDGRTVSPADIVHVPWITVPGRTLGLSPIEAFAYTTNAGLSAQRYGSEWFDNGGFPPAVFKNVQRNVSPKDSADIRTRFTATLRDRQPLVHGAEWDFTPITVPPEQAQFIETQKLTANQIAAIYGIEPDEIGGEAANSLTYSTEEMRQIKRLANWRPWMVRFENAFSSWLPSMQQVKFNGDATIRADLKTRWEVNKLRVDMGVASIDDIRAQEDQEPLPNGQGQQYGARPIAAGPTQDSPSGDVVPMRRTQ
jgi:HK97 family phage portal protein